MILSLDLDKIDDFQQIPSNHKESVAKIPQNINENGPTKCMLIHLNMAFTRKETLSKRLKSYNCRTCR